MTFPTGWDGPKYFAAQLAPEPVRTDWSAPTGEPGIIQPRPLSFGDILGGIFSAVRYSPGTMFGLTVVLTLAAQLIGIGVGYLLGQEFGFDPLAEDESGLPTLSWASLIGLAATSFAELITGIGLRWATFQAVLAKKAAPLDAARQIVRRFWAMVGLYAVMLLIWAAPVTALILVLAPSFADNPDGVSPAVAIPATLVLATVMAWLSVRLILAPCVVAIENRGPFAAIRRSWFLTRGRFWRIVGIYLGSVMLIWMATNVLSTVFTLASALIAAGNTELASTIVLSASTLTSAVFSLPLTSALATLIYVDARIRAEAFDLELSEELFG